MQRAPSVTDARPSALGMFSILSKIARSTKYRLKSDDDEDDELPIRNSILGRPHYADKHAIIPSTYQLVQCSCDLPLHRQLLTTRRRPLLRRTSRDSRSDSMQLRRTIRSICRPNVNFAKWLLVLVCDLQAVRHHSQLLF